MKSKKRKPPIKPEPVTHDGIRYEAIFLKVPGLFDEAGSVIAAFDAESDDLLWQLKVYDDKLGDNMEGDKRTIYISRMELEPDGSNLQIDHERGGRYRVSLADQTVEVLPRGEPKRLEDP